MEYGKWQIIKKCHRSAPDELQIWMWMINNKYSGRKKNPNKLGVSFLNRTQKALTIKKKKNWET